jgi:hypothetical protein
VAANGVTINGASFLFTNLGNVSLATGTKFVILDNTSTFGINGVFNNLADNSTFTNNGNTYSVSYEGGDGNDLTLTVVPEPSAWQLLIAGSLLLFTSSGKRKSKRSNPNAG